MKKVYLLLLLCCMGFAVSAQTAASYVFSRTTGTYQTISGSGTLFTAVNCDDCSSGGIPIGFTFNFCGTNYTTLSASSNGWLSLQGLTYCCAYPGYNTEIGYNGGSTIMPNGWLFPFWRDDYGGYGGSNCYYQTTGVAPNRVFTFEYYNWDNFSNSGIDQNVQVKLFENTNVIQFLYGPYVSTPGDYSIGIANTQTDYQILPNGGATSTVTSGFTSGTCSAPNPNSLLQWCPAPAAITGSVPFCTGTTNTLTEVFPPNGSWSSSNPAIATVGSGTGIVTGVSGGTANITYTTLGCNLTAVQAVTVLPTPAAITGNAPVNVCATVTLSDPSGSGSWVSSNTGIATVGLSSGIVTGVSPGTATITFTLTGGCSVTTVVTVNALPAITGTANVCVGLTTALSHSTPGGTWTSSNVALATVTPSGGVVSGIAAGTPTITYTVPGGCFVTLPFVVNPTPAAITGITTLCATQTTTLSDATIGGTWSSSNVGLATVGSSSGIVTGVAAGNPVITYTSSAGCFVTQPVTVNALSAITGSTSMCLGFGTTLSDATPGGTWSSSNPAVASIGSSTGVVTSVSVGSSIISYTMPVTGCRALATVNVTNSPVTYAVTGGGAYCAGGIGVHIGVNSSDVGVSYTLFNGATIVGTVTGTGSAVDFGLITAAGTYTVVANYGTSCATTMSGSATVTVNALPTGFTVTGGGSYCSGGTGVHVFLNSSQIGVNYQLYYGVTPVGSAIAGTSGSLDFGLVTSASPPSYTVLATNATTACQNPMTGSANVSINPLPGAFTVTSSGTSYCLGGTGVSIGLSGSAVGINYQLYYMSAPLGSVVPGTGSSLSFGLQTGAGAYTVVATNPATGCQSTMSGTINVTINPLPTVFSVTGGGAYCLGGTGVVVGLNASTIGVNYQLYNGLLPVGAPVAGTGASISFGLQTVAGSYTVVATNATTGCVNNMFGSANVSINPLPAVFSVTGGGGYCAGGTGVHIGLASSVIGTTYQLFNGLTLVGAASGTGASLDFGLFTAAGTYTVVGTITATGCVGNMAGSVTITINPIPNIFTVTGGGNYCAGGTGVAIGLSGSNTGINYQLYNGVSPVGSPVAGSGSAITFGLQTAAGSYSVIATNATTGCTANMTGSAIITVNPLPTIYAVTGGGGYCAGGTGVNVGLAASNVGINYQLYNGVGAVGTPVAGTGFAISFGLQTAAGTYTVQATNTSTACSTTMAGSVVITINPLPAPFSVSGTGSYCAGGTGVAVLLSNSVVGINYQLFNGTTTMGAPLAGTGSSLNFGPQTVAGVYTVVATNATTGCTNNMIGSATITINPLPAVFSVTGGGTYCTGGAGVHIGVSGSVVGTSYQLMNGLIPVGAAMPGTGGAIDFGLITGTGTYTVVATITATGCQTNMSGSVTIGTSALPGLFTITGGGSFCAGGTGMHIGLSGSAVGVNYQLYNGTTPMGAPVSGTGGALDFGLQTAAGTYTVVGTNVTTGCSSTMTGTTTITVNTLPVLHTVTGGGSYCPSGPGVVIGLDGSNTGTSYQLYNGAAPVGAPVPGSTGFPITFGLQTATGVYTVMATNTTTGCSVAMTGSATVGIYALPVVYNVTGGGNYCAGGAGVVVGLSGSNTGINYQLFDGSAPMGAPVAGTGLAITFGLQTTAGVYTVVATSATTTCTNNMAGSATVGINPLPALHTVTGGGNYCAGGTGVVVGLDGSNVGTNYQLYNGFSTVGAPVAGTGAAISFGLQTAAGTYTVVATNTATTCTNTMTSSVTIGIDPLPNAYILSGGGSLCVGGAGVDIMLSGSDAGNTYQLYRGTTAVGAPMLGTGIGIDFGLQTTAGTYTVVATSTATGCNNTMTGSVVVSVNPLPTTYIVSGGGNYCSGGSGLHIMLSGSNAGISYQLYIGSGPVGAPMLGTGMGLDFGLQTGGGVYTVVATNSTTGCTNTMTGSATITINPLPTMYTVVSTSSSYCVGGAGVDIALTGSDVGTTYQLYNGTTTVGAPISGTGAPIDFGYILPAGSYTVVATITATGCFTNMLPGVTITVNSLPTVYTITGGGQYCTGGTGVHIGLSGSNSGVNYQLYRGVVAVGSPVAGTGSALDFGLITGAGSYTVVATNPTTTCTNNMSGSVTIAVNPLPVTYNVTGGGQYCAGGAGVHVGLANSTLSVNYQLYRGLTAVGSPVAGTGTAIDFGFQTVAGTYTAVATNSITGCVNNMTSSAVVVVNPLPTAFTMTGGGNYCPGGSGVHVGISGSVVGTSYQLYNGTTAMGTSIPGTGSGIDFGLQTSAGTYTVVATDGTTGCTATMTGSVTVIINALPTAYSVVGGGSYCAGGSGVTVGLSNSTVGVNYTLYAGVVNITTMPGTGGPVNFGLMTASGTYTVLATDATTTCSNYMSGSVTVTVTPVVTPFVTISTTHDTVCSGTFTTFTAMPVNGGGTPSYQWTVNGSPAALGGVYSYVPSDGDVVGISMTSSAACAIPATVTSSKTMTVNGVQTPSVSIAANPGNVVCQGSTVTFSATPTYGGSAPTYVWMKNGNPVGTSSSYAYIPANHDVITAVLTSNYQCRTTATATSTPITMTVDAPVTPIVVITANPGTHISAGQQVTFTANVTNGGSSPSYQWLVNGVPMSGAISAIYISSTLNNDDSVTCQVTANGGCPGLVGIGSITVHISTGVTVMNTTGADIQLVPNPNKGTFTVKGSLGTNVDEEVSLELTNMLGQVIYTSKVMTHNGDINEKVQLSNTPANGMYILNVRTTSENKVFHMVIEQ